LTATNKAGVDFIKQFTPYALNLRSAPIILERFSLIWHYALRTAFCIFLIQQRSMLLFLCRLSLTGLGLVIETKKKLKNSQNSGTIL
jgi:hypothetical protein